MFDNPEDCEYTIEYANVRGNGTFGETTRIVTNQATYDYYVARGVNSFDPVCLEGEK
jgi:hypothetical protein